jgi:hypothetical protein
MLRCFKKVYDGVEKVFDDGVLKKKVMWVEKKNLC